uniref:TIGR00255 family protein n=1 Tax=Candidatus Kentrum eta TaxID=2126337 RepID=A0A450UC88_9GAMM|nr:MAG: TIGR00255 family protein [Candidatus Kentron sp. H]VFJ89912.1 MAG: TIGR00255 family protein [Candidatus Kentron sp. H]VFJ96302.1 MAG: TIGR00255 family protein [Candidatus Kentron sp. H]
MIYSMTAFARREEQGGENEETGGEISWELRSVNHRYLDVTVRLPEDLRSLEPVVRERVRDRIGRGKVECLLRYQSTARRETQLHVDLELAGQVVAALHRISGLLPNGGTVSPLGILRWPGVVYPPPAPNLEAVKTPILNVLDQALTELLAMRWREGEKLTALIRARCAEVSDIVDRVRERLPTILAAQRARLLDRLSEVEAEIDPDRLEQDLVLIAQKIDVAEELDRLDTHLAEVERALGGGPSEKTGPGKNPMGRRLDFLMQEMHREANTLGAKSVDTAVTGASVDLRVLIEQMREQVQNVE